MEDGKLAHVPTRSRPAEVFDLPTWDGQFWDLTGNNRRVLTGVVYSDHVKYRTEKGEWKILPSGRYVRAIPPIVPPEPAAISDADVMKYLVGCYHMAGSSSHIPGPRPTNADVERLLAKVSQPPIDPPAKAEPDADAQWLRWLSSRDPDNWASASIRLARIADDLERLKREAKEAGHGH